MKYGLVMSGDFIQRLREYILNRVPFWFTYLHFFVLSVSGKLTFIILVFKSIISCGVLFPPSAPPPSFLLLLLLLRSQVQLWAKVLQQMSETEPTEWFYKAVWHHEPQSSINLKVRLSKDVTKLLHMTVQHIVAFHWGYEVSIHLNFELK